jgi:hypothetical protein
VCGEDVSVGAVNDVRQQAQSCPPGEAGATGTGVGASGDGEQFGPEQGVCFLMGGGIGAGLAAAGTLSRGITIT